MPLTTNNTKLEVWSERDRFHIDLQDLNGNTIAEWWDADAFQMFEDGFFDDKAFIMGRLHNKTKLHASVVEYANSVGLKAA